MENLEKKRKDVADYRTVNYFNLSDEKIVEAREENERELRKIDAEMERRKKEVEKK